MSNDVSVFIGSPTADTEEGKLLLKLAEELDIDWEREVLITGEPDISLGRKSTATIEFPVDEKS